MEVKHKWWSKKELAVLGDFKQLIEADLEKALEEIRMQLPHRSSDSIISKSKRLGYIPKNQKASKAKILSNKKYKIEPKYCSQFFLWRAEK